MGNVYTQSNEAENKIINFMQTADGRLIEVQRVATGGKGTNGYVPVTGEMTSPDSLISANAVITSKDRSVSCHSRTMYSAFAEGVKPASESTSSSWRMILPTSSCSAGCRLSEWNRSRTAGCVTRQTLHEEK